MLGALLAKLEKDKPTLELGPGDKQYCENFAFGVFGRADKVDRAGRADRNTAMTFYAASVFFEVLPPFMYLYASALWSLGDMLRPALLARCVAKTFSISLLRQSLLECLAECPGVVVRWCAPGPRLVAALTSFA